MGNGKNVALEWSRKNCNPTFVVENSFRFVCHCTTPGEKLVVFMEKRVRMMYTNVVADDMWDGTLLCHG